MIQLTANVFVESDLRVCNLGFVITKEGIVMIDTPVRPSDAVRWRDEVSKRGELRYLINTEEHPDHCQSSWLFPQPLITSQETRDKLEVEPVDEVMERVKRTDPDGLPLMESFHWRLADIAFTGSMNLYLGEHTFSLLSLPGHSTGGIGVYIPEERVVFATDCVFHQLKSWLHESIPEQWFESLRKLGELSVDNIVPGHGAICKKDYLEEQAGIVRRWVELVQSAIKQGLSEEEAANTITVPDPYHIDPRIPMPEPELNRQIVARLYQLYSK